MHTGLEADAYGGADKVTRSILMGIAMAARGYDPTKGSVPGGATSYANPETEQYKIAGKKYTCRISSHVFYSDDEYAVSSSTGDYGEFEYRDDEDEWQKEFVLQLCITIKNSYYFENSETLEKIIAWTQMETEEANRREEEAYGTSQY